MQLILPGSVSGFHYVLKQQGGNTNEVRKKMYSDQRVRDLELGFHYASMGAPVCSQ